MRYYYPFILALALGCSSAELEPELETDSLVDLPEGDSLPLELSVLGYDYPAQLAPSWEETRAVLQEADGSQGALLESLVATGLDEQSAILMVNLAAGHGSGQPHDPVRVQADEIQVAYRQAAAQFAEELRAVEAREGMQIDRTELEEAGVVLSWEDTP